MKRFSWRVWLRSRSLSSFVTAPRSWARASPRDRGGPGRVPEGHVDDPILLDLVAMDQHVAVNGHGDFAYILAAVSGRLDFREVGRARRDRADREVGPAHVFAHLVADAHLEPREGVRGLGRVVGVAEGVGREGGEI